MLAAAFATSATTASAASYTWDGTTASYVLTSSDDFTYTAGTVAAGGLAVTARDFDISGNLTLGGAFSFTQTGGGGLYQGIDLLASSTITATSISLTGDVGKQGSDGNTLTLDTSAANGAINLNVSLGRANVWYIPAGLTANAGSGTITVSGTNGQGWRSAPVALSGGAVDFGSDTAFAGSVSYKGGSIQGAFTGTANVAGTGVALVDGALSGGTIVVGAGASVDVTSYTGAVRLTGGSVSQGLGGFSGTIELADGGSLNLTTESAASATIVVADGGALRGVGTVGAATVATGGLLAPGNSPGLQTFTTLSLEGGSAYDLEIQSTYAGLISPVAGTDYDSVNVIGQLDLSGVSSANRLILNLISLVADGSTTGDLADFDPSVPLVFDVFTYGGITGYTGSIEDYFTLDTTQLTFNGSALSGANFSLVDTGTAIQLQCSPIPEPSTYGLILGGMALAGAAVRRRRAKRG